MPIEQFEKKISNSSENIQAEDCVTIQVCVHGSENT